MRLKNILITVTDMECSKRFYKELFGLDIIVDNDRNVILTEGLVLQDRTLWEQTTGIKAIPNNNASLLYFEERDMEDFAKKLNQYEETNNTPIVYLSQLMQTVPDRKVLRFYDPDGNLIEVGSPWR